MSGGKSGMQTGESVFCVVYLLFDLAAGIIFLRHGADRLFLLYGVMTLLLGSGDAFHLVPRVIANMRGESPKVRWWMDLGLAVASITMTVFYIILYYIWKELNAGRHVLSVVPVIIWASALVRIGLCLLPQNDWFGEGNRRLSIIRNGVFLITGLADAALFGMMGGFFGIAMACCIVLSFLFYLPVTLCAKSHPRVGILMLPKTVMYVMIVSLGLSMLP